MKKILFALCFLFGCVAPGMSVSDDMTQTVPTAPAPGENVGVAQQDLYLCTSYCTACTYLDSRCEPVQSECYNIETNSVPYICHPGDTLPGGKSCFQASTNSYEWCCCNTGTCIPN